MSASPSPDDDLFPSGEWTGFYIQGRRQYRQDLVLIFTNGRMRGTGGDSLGGFAIRGRYDVITLEVTWTKTYIGAHSVYYRGFREGKGIWGTWEIGGSFRGGFQIWPRRAGEYAEATESKEQEVALPATANGAKNETHRGGWLA